MNRVSTKHRRPAAASRLPASGISLLELLLAVALGSLMSLTLVQLAMAAGKSFRLQESLAELQENSRFFADLLAVNFSDSGYHPQPWLHDSTPIGLMPESVDAINTVSDRLVSRSWSDRNCFGAINSASSPAGNPAFRLREAVLEHNNGSLAFSCRYGPASNAMTTQVNRQGVIPEVEAFQALFARDADGDGEIDQWVRAGDWSDISEVLAVRLAILSSSRNSVVPPEARTYRLLDFSYSAPADGRLRQVSSYTIPLQRRLP